MDDMSKINDSISQTTDDWCQKTDDYARREPTRAVVSAFGLGVLLNFLPLRLIVSAIIGVFLLLLRPALLFLGLMKLTECVRSENKKSDS